MSSTKKREAAFRARVLAEVMDRIKISTADEDAVKEVIYTLYGGSKLKAPKIIAVDSPEEAVRKIVSLPYSIVHGNVPVLASYKKLIDLAMNTLAAQMIRTIRGVTPQFRGSGKFWQGSSVVSSVVGSMTGFAEDWSLHPVNNRSLQSNPTKSITPTTNSLVPGSMEAFAPHHTAMDPSLLTLALCANWEDSVSSKLNRVERARLYSFADLHLAGAFYVWFYAGVCVWCRPPAMKIIPTADGSSREFHSETGPSVQFRNGDEAYYWHGVQVPEQLIMAPETYRAKDIVMEPNQEIKRTAFERIGWEKVLDELGAVSIQRDDYGELVEAVLGDDDGMPARFCKVACPSTGRVYMIRVDPQTRTCHEGLAKAAGLTKKEYSFAVET